MRKTYECSIIYVRSSEMRLRKNYFPKDNRFYVLRVSATPKLYRNNPEESRVSTQTREEYSEKEIEKIRPKQKEKH